MRITHRMLSGSVSRNLYHNLYRLQKLSNQLSMGKKFDRPSQDPVGTYKVMQLAGVSLARNEQYRSNIGEAETWLMAAENALAEAIDVMQRLRELAVNASNETLSELDRKMIAPEVEELWNHLVSLGNAELGGLYIFGGHKSLEPPFVVAGEGGYLNSYTVDEAAGLAKEAFGAGGLPSGDYSISTEKLTAFTSDGAVKLLEEYIQGFAPGFLCEAAFSRTGDSKEDLAASVLLELTGVEMDHETKTYRLTLKASYHVYDLEGNCYSGEKTGLVLEMNKESDVDDNINIIDLGEFGGGALKLQLSGAPYPDGFMEDYFAVGDKLLLEVSPKLPAGDYDRVTLRTPQGEEAHWYFNGGQLDEQKQEFQRFFLDGKTGRAFDGRFELTFDGELQAATEAVEFAFTAAGQLYYRGDEGKRMVEITPSNTIAANVTGQEAFGGTFVFDTAFNMRYALLNNEQFTLSREVLADLDKSLDYLLQRRAEIGARVARLEATDARLHSEHIHLREILSKIEDIDIAETITEYIMQENAYSAALSTGARMIQPSLIDFLR